MTTQENLQLAQLVLAVVGILGLAFALGRIYGRIEGLEKGLAEMKHSLFGLDGSEGAFVRQSTLRLILESKTREHGEFDRRLSDVGERVAQLERNQR